MEDIDDLSFLLNDDGGDTSNVVVTETILVRTPVRQTRASLAKSKQQAQRKRVTKKPAPKKVKKPAKPRGRPKSATSKTSTNTSGRQRRPRPKLDYNVLLSENGFPFLQKKFELLTGLSKDVSEEIYIKMLFQILREWHLLLMPIYTFEDFIEKIQALGAKGDARGLLECIRNHDELPIAFSKPDLPTFEEDKTTSTSLDNALESSSKKVNEISEMKDGNSDMEDEDFVDNRKNDNPIPRNNSSVQRSNTTQHKTNDDFDLDDLIVEESHRNVEREQQKLKELEEEQRKEKERKKRERELEKEFERQRETIAAKKAARKAARKARKKEKKEQRKRKKQQKKQKKSKKQKKEETDEEAQAEQEVEAEEEPLQEDDNQQEHADQKTNNDKNVEQTDESKQEIIATPVPRKRRIAIRRLARPSTAKTNSTISRPVVHKNEASDKENESNETNSTTNKKRKRSLTSSAMSEKQESTTPPPAKKRRIAKRRFSLSKTAQSTSNS